MGAFDYLFQGSPPPAVTTAVGSTTGLPDWYQELIRGVAGKASDIAGRTQEAPLPTLGVAGFSPDQLAAFQRVRDNSGVYRPSLDAAGAALGKLPGAVQGYADMATGAASGPAKSWADNWQKYMSPYTQGVVDNIARLGKRNFEENIMPGVNAEMIGAGQFASTRNADILGRAARDASADITGRQAEALQAGYGTSAGIFSDDAQREQAQRSLQAGTALGAGSNVASSLTGAAGGYGALGQAWQSMGLNDANALMTAGGAQQGLNQTDLDARFANSWNNINFDWNTLNNLNSVMRGMPLNNVQVATQTGPAQVYRPGGLQSVAAGYNMARG